MSLDILINLIYIVSAILFIYGLKMLSSPATARRGNFISAIGMFLAVVTTLINKEVVDFQWIVLGFVIGAVIGAFAARLIAMTQMPEMVALFNGFGGIASLLVGWGAYHSDPSADSLTITTIFLSILIGAITFSGSLIAFAKLSEIIGGKPTLFPGQKVFNILILIGIIAVGVLFIMNPVTSYDILIAIIVLSLILGVLAVIPIGGADMPVVISLLNSYSGLAACAAGFVIQNNILIVSGALVGASGIILTKIMCKAMNRSLANVLFSGFGATTTGKGGGKQEGEVKPIVAEDAYFILEAASSVAFVPGYGLAVAQAQHVVRELGDL
ncbi:MAG: NAD(P)(+) transhydrogenase (Re/Si-specific) subunit beta, partial [Calditrichia bacterium]|nr:NAD(P)(+) transhydrogenase (Re/Si-specific) subunit beta [Calditrichia bacterium]